MALGKTILVIILIVIVASAYAQRESDENSTEDPDPDNDSILNMKSSVFNVGCNKGFYKIKNSCREIFEYGK